jgi:hypothetical protein
MNSSTYLIRLTRVLILGAAVAGTAVSAAGAQAPVGGPPYRDTASSQGYQSRSASQALVGGQPYRDTASSQGYQSRPVEIPDVVERYATAHPYGSGVSATTDSTLVAVPDVFERYAAAHPYGSGIASTLSQPNGFDWGDYAIGIGTGMGLILILAGGLAVGRQRRHGVQTA